MLRVIRAEQVYFKKDIYMEIYNDIYCVYIHTNKINGKMYIGQTCQDPEDRWKNGNGYKKCTYFYRAIQKYGWDNFEHEIIASHLTLDEANNFEELLIGVLNTMNPNNGYNLKSGGKSNLLSELTKRKIGKANKGHKMSEEQKNKLIESHKGKPLTDETKRKIAASQRKIDYDNYDMYIVQYDKNGVFIKTFDTVSQADKEYPGCRSVLKGSSKTSHGYIFKYK